MSLPKIGIDLTTVVAKKQNYHGGLLIFVLLGRGEWGIFDPPGRGGGSIKKSQGGGCLRGMWGERAKYFISGPKSPPRITQNN